MTTDFVSFDDDGNIVIDRDALHERLREEDLEEALERDDVNLSFAENFGEEMGKALAEADAYEVNEDE